jgi:peptidoglycan/LPS O-acetylase OafA/YrhL
VADRDRSANLDMLRAIAALMVLGAHAYLLAGAGVGSRFDTSPDQLAINNLSSGVWLFFALSGYLIPRAFLRALIEGSPLPPLSSYLVRRGARILPAYWIALFVMLLIVDRGVPIHWWQYPLHLSLLQNQIGGEGQNLFYVAWTLGIEALFYLSVPLGAYALRALHRGPIDVGRLAAVVVGVWIASLGWVVWAAHTYPDTGALTAVANADVFRLNLPPMLSMFCPGMLVWLAESPQAAVRGGPWSVYRQVVSRPWLALSIAAALIVAAAYAFTSKSTVVFDLSKELWALSAGLILATALQGWAWLRPLARALAPIGLISYGIYLWHWVAVEYLERHWHPLARAGVGPWLVHVAIVLAFAVPVATVSWIAIERPLLRRTADWTRQRRFGWLSRSHV